MKDSRKRRITFDIDLSISLPQRFEWILSGLIGELRWSCTKEPKNARYRAIAGHLSRI